MIKYIFAILALFQAYAIDYNDKNSFSSEELKIVEQCKKYVDFYALEDKTQPVEITQKLLESKLIIEEHKEFIKEQGRRFFVFSYPSDGLQIKGYISFVENGEGLLVFLRGGTGFFGLRPPANSLSCFGRYTVLATTYRGGMNEGVDELGGDDVNDVPNLVWFIPVLEEKLGRSFTYGKKYVLGGSRGGKQMFLALTRYPELQSYFDKAISLSGSLDLEVTLQTRPDMVAFFKSLGYNSDDPEWRRYRNPYCHVDKIGTNFPIFLVQGTEDVRVHLDHGKRMYEALKERGCQVDYLEIEGGNHCLQNRSDRLEILQNWLAQ